jgi:hypothetical protein
MNIDCKPYSEHSPSFGRARPAPPKELMAVKEHIKVLEEELRLDRAFQKAFRLSRSKVTGPSLMR